MVSQEGDAGVDAVGGTVVEVAGVGAETAGGAFEEEVKGGEEGGEGAEVTAAGGGGGLEGAEMARVQGAVETAGEVRLSPRARDAPLKEGFAPLRSIVHCEHNPMFSCANGRYLGVTNARASPLPPHVSFALLKHFPTNIQVLHFLCAFGSMVPSLFRVDCGTHDQRRVKTPWHKAEPEGIFGGITCRESPGVFFDFTNHTHFLALPSFLIGTSRDHPHRNIR